MLELIWCYLILIIFFWTRCKIDLVSSSISKVKKPPKHTFPSSLVCIFSCFLSLYSYLVSVKSPFAFVVHIILMKMRLLHVLLIISLLISLILRFLICKSQVLIAHKQIPLKVSPLVFLVLIWVINFLELHIFKLQNFGETLIRVFDLVNSANYRSLNDFGSLSDQINSVQN